MQSTIKISFDPSFGNCPIIEVVAQRNTNGPNDVKDELITSFMERLGTLSNWAAVKTVSYQNMEGRVTRIIHIVPIAPDRLSVHAKAMTEAASQYVPSDHQIGDHPDAVFGIGDNITATSIEKMDAKS